MIFNSISIWTCLFISISSTHALSTLHLKEVPCHPEEVHISFGDQVSDVVVIWSTLDNCNTSVEYGKDPWNITATVSGQTKQFTQKNPSGLQYLHRAILKGLSPETTYYYRPVSSEIRSGPFFFRTPPAGKDWSPEFLIYGDLGVESDSIPPLSKEATSGKYTAAFHVGDFAYNMHDNGGQQEQNSTNSTTSHTDEACYSQTGDTFMRLIESFASRLQYMTSPGNHEINDDTFAHYRYRFSMPGTEWPIPLHKMWYSIDIGPVHFVSYSTEVFFTENGRYITTQENWLKTDLYQANNNRDNCPWVIALGHRPLYCSNSDNDDCTKADSKVRAGLEDIFFKYGVDIVLQAHEHSYERLYPMYKGVVLNNNFTNPLAPVQLISGAAGSKHREDKENRNAEKWSAFRSGTTALNSVGKLKIHNSSHVTWTQFNIITGEVIDSVTIQQENHGPFKQVKLTPTVSPKIEKEKEKETNVKVLEKTHSASNANETSSSVTEDDKPMGAGQKIKSFLTHVNNKIAVGVGCGVLLLIIIIVAAVVCRKKRPSRKYRRWDEKIDYGRKFYSSYNHVDNNDKDADDFEVDVTDGNSASSKLLTDDK